MDASFCVLHGETMKYPIDATGKQISVYEHIEAAAIAYPEKIAVTYHDEKVTYRELIAFVNGMAKKFVVSGVKPSSHVALYNHRSIDYIIAVLAIIKIGAIYTPLDPVDSSEVTSGVLENFSTVWVCVAPSLTFAYTDKLTKSVEMLDETTVTYINFERNPMPRFQSDYRSAVTDIRYAIATSGSTGKPKCVLVDEISMLLQQHCCA